jgi:rhamnopyranosyl-N-acetylglucosaminyl-diphospho-decaprenol beta-1,3/1,4-galactofuranosyltransferase
MSSVVAQTAGEGVSVPNSTTRVAAVVVTFNRKILLGRCLDALLGQMRPVDRIIVIDCCSTDGTSDFLKSGGYLDKIGLEYVQLSENVGGAGGFYEGMKRAYEYGYDWIWAMDDDCSPSRAALELLLNAGERNPPAVYGPRNVDAVTGSELWYHWPDGKAKDLMPVRSIAFNGLFVPRAAVTAAGLPFRDFRICADDVEYCQRAREKGYQTIIVTQAVVYHPEPAVFEWGRLGTRPLLVYPKYRSPERVYYHLRNWTYVLMRHWRTFGRFASLAQLRIMVCLVCFGQISPRLAFKAVVDGMRLRSVGDGLD